MHRLTDICTCSVEQLITNPCFFQKGKFLQAKTVSYKKKMPEPMPALKRVESILRKDSKGRTIVQCVKEGNLIKVRPMSKGLESQSHYYYYIIYIL